MKARISSFMGTRKKKIGAVVMSLALAASLSTGLVLAASANAPANTPPGIGAEFTDQYGYEITTDLSKVGFGGRIIVDSDGRITAAQNDMPEGLLGRGSLLAGSNLPQVTLERDEWVGAEISSFGFSTDGVDSTIGSPIGIINPIEGIVAPMPRTFTDAEWAQVLADIESGIIQPLTSDSLADMFTGRDVVGIDAFFVSEDDIIKFEVGE